MDHKTIDFSGELYGQNQNVGLGWEVSEVSWADKQIEWECKTKLTMGVALAANNPVLPPSHRDAF